MPLRVAQTTPLGAAAPTEDEEGGPPEAMAVADMFSMPPREDRMVDVSDSYIACRLKSFTRRVLKKVGSPLFVSSPSSLLLSR
jgi:hypothetical protein